MQITGDNYNYFKNVIRLKNGQNFRIFSDKSGEFMAQITDFSRHSVSAEIGEKLKNVENPPNLSLGIAIIKPDCFLQAVRAAVQIGVTDIFPLVTEYTHNPRINYDKIHRCIIETIEQCERTTIPELHNTQNLQEFLERKFNSIIWCDEQAPNNCKISDVEILNDHDTAVLVGPEGGFSEEERQYLLLQNNIKPVSLGYNVLKSEIAVISALSCTQMVRKSA